MVLLVARGGHASPSISVISDRMDQPAPKNNVNHLVKSISFYSASRSAGEGGKHADLDIDRC